MQARSLLTTTVLVLAAATLGASCASTSRAKTTAPQDAAAHEAEMMEKWMAFATPGDAHKVLDPRTGKWNFAVKFWHTPDAPPGESTGTSETKWIMDGRYLHDETHGSFEGQPFHGMGISGYDNLKKKYFGTWIDNMGTGLMVSEGTYDPAKKTITYESNSPDVMAGKYVKGRIVERYDSRDAWTMEMYGPDPTSGKEFKMMEIAYKRAR